MVIKMIKRIYNHNLRVLIKIILLKVFVLIFLFLVRPPTTMIADVEMYYNLTKNPTETFKPPGTPIEKIGLYSPNAFKPPGWVLFLYPFYLIYPNWVFWGLFFSFIFSTFALYLLSLISNEKTMWLLFFYPYFLYHSNFPLEVSILSFLITLSFYFLKKKRIFFSNLICNISGFFRPEGILVSFYVLLKKINIKNVLIFGITTFLAFYVYAYSFIFLNSHFNPPLVSYPRYFIPFLIPLLIDYRNFFTRHFWKVLTLWFIFGLTLGYFKVFYEWSVLS
jgi:hypothetical protein